MTVIAILLAALGGAVLGWTVGLSRPIAWRDVAAAALVVAGIALAAPEGVLGSVGAFVMALIAAEAVAP